MFWKLLRRYFFVGIIILLPIIITGYIIIFAFNLVDGILRNLIQYIAGRPLPGLGFLIIIVLIIFAGAVGTNVFGKKLLHFGDGIFQRIPIVKTIYTATKQVMEAFTPQRRAAFQHVVMIEYPRKGVYSLGFVTGEAPAEIEDKVQDDLVNVYLPTTPPTQGYFLMVPRQDVNFLEMSVEDGFKLLISAGIITSAPSYQKK